MPMISFGCAPLVAEPNTGPIEITKHNSRYVGFLPETTNHSIHLALKIGIRHFDTALLYRSQTSLRQVLGHWFMNNYIKRQDIFITSKIYHPPAPGFAIDDTSFDMDSMTTVEEVRQAVKRDFQRCLIELGVGYVDLMLLHWPGSGGGLNTTTTNDIDNEATTTATATEHNNNNEQQQVPIDPIKRAKRFAAWKVLEEFYSIGWARAIGVSNFTEVHLQHLIEDGATICPMVNQLETSVYCKYNKIIEYCHTNNIIVQAYSPFGRGVSDIINDPIIQSIAKKHSCTTSPGQIALKYLFQLGIPTIFLSSSEQHIQSNFHTVIDKEFVLDNEDMKMLETLQKKHGTWGLPSPYSIP